MLCRSDACHFDIMICMIGPNFTQVRRSHEDLRKRRLDEFMGGFNTVSLKLKEMYQMITLGGDAELELVDSLDPFSEVNSCCLPLNARRCRVRQFAHLVTVSGMCAGTPRPAVIHLIHHTTLQYTRVQTQAGATVGADTIKMSCVNLFCHQGHEESD